MSSSYSGGQSIWGIEVNHILSDGTLQNQRKLDERLLDMYFPEREQLSIFNYNDIPDDDEYITRAYRKRNEEIGYHIDLKQFAAV